MTEPVTKPVVSGKCRETEAHQFPPKVYQGEGESNQRERVGPGVPSLPGDCEGRDFLLC